jgi:hypothetical protein
VWGGCPASKIKTRNFMKYTSHLQKVSIVRLLKRIYFQNMLFLSDSPYLKLLFYIVSTIIKVFIIIGHQFLYPLLAECGYL